jgi:hypothetical protein
MNKTVTGLVINETTPGAKPTITIFSDHFLAQLKTRGTSRVSLRLSVWPPSVIVMDSSVLVCLQEYTC